MPVITTKKITANEQSPLAAAITTNCSDRKTEPPAPTPQPTPEPKLAIPTKAVLQQLTNDYCSDPGGWTAKDDYNTYG